MIKLRFLDLEKNKEFEKDYTDNIEKARKMYIKCKFSKKLRVIQITCDTIEQYYYIMGIRWK